MSLWQTEYPFASHYLTIGSYRMHFVDEGPGEARREERHRGGDHEGLGPIVCVHGNPTWSFYYREIVKHFRATRRVLAVDHIGCGLSDKPQKYPYCLQQHIDNLVTWFRSLDLKRVTLVVHDWGGAIGLGAAEIERDRIERLVILNTGAFPPPYVPYRIAACRIPAIGTLGVRGLNLFARAALTMAIARKKKLSPAAASGLIAPYDRWHNRIAIDRFVQDIPTSPRDATWSVLERIEANLSTLADRPTLMIWGMKDWCFRPECLERLLKSLPKAEVHRLEDVGHYVMEDAPEEAVALIEQFLATT